MPTQLITCCSANEPTQVCNAPDGNDNGSNISSGGVVQRPWLQEWPVLKSDPSNSCPEPNAVNTTGKKWTSDLSIQ